MYGILMTDCLVSQHAQGTKNAGEEQRAQQAMLAAALAQQSILARHQAQQSLFKEAREREQERAAEGVTGDVAPQVKPFEASQVAR